MKLAQLIAELQHHNNFATYAELLGWLSQRAVDLSSKNIQTSPVDLQIIKLLQLANQKVGYRCEFGPGEPEHQRSDECWYCHKSICARHAGRALEFHDVTFSICPADVDKINEAELERVAQELVAEEVYVCPTCGSDGHHESRCPAADRRLQLDVQ